MNEIAYSEMICRQETYGGTLFHPFDATFIQLDHDGFDCVSRVFGHKMKPRNSDERDFIAEVTRNLPSIDMPVRLVNQTAPSTVALPGILSAPILVDFQITERCGMGCPQCYASSVTKGKDVSWEDAELAVAQMREAGVCQVALGGGEPVYYPRLDDLLSLIRDNGMVPNLTTTGVGMTEGQMNSMLRNCGAVAMSLEGVHERFAIRRKTGFENFQRTAERFLAKEIPLVMQVTVSSQNLEDLDSIVEYCLTVRPLYGVVFLAHKPAGRATSYDKPLSALDYSVVHEKVLRAVKALHPHTRVGFDCCFTPGMVGLEQSLGFAPATIVEGCSATRSGIGLTPQLDVLPCTFLPEKKLGNLREKSLLEIWRDTPSGGFRSAMKVHATEDSRCRSCSSNSSCMGGCSVWSLVGCVTKEPLL
jgi:radical SAM protein with 4Fe4S-binding SPASM domain